MKPKNISREEYVEIFCCDRRIRDRKVVYISAQTHAKLRRIVRLFVGEYQTIASLVDAIITHHIDTYGPLLNRLEEWHNREFREWLSQIGKPKKERD